MSRWQSNAGTHEPAVLPPGQPNSLPENGATSSCRSGTLIVRPSLCPKYQNPTRIIAVIDQRVVIEKILRHFGQWNGTPPLAPARAPPAADAGPWTR
ncbi:MAG: hypothetical protein EXS31_07080 [Pedosphaera sp.]|nr:hypothetical protein [Pedosphaera sp.]